MRYLVMMLVRAVAMVCAVTALGGCEGGRAGPANSGSALYPANAPIGAAFGARTLAPTDIPSAAPAADGTAADAGQALVPNGLPTGVSGVSAAGSENGVVGVEHLPPF